MDKKLFALLSGCLLSGIAEAGQTKPNVIIIYTDDHGTLDANCFGAPDLCTPNIDALATYGVRFTQFYAAPVSSDPHERCNDLGTVSTRDPVKLKYL